MIDVAALLAARRVVAHFQPIVSLRRREVIGYEALARGVGEAGIIPPLALFEAARQQGLALELDRLCRETALRAFAASALHPALLFLNVDATVLSAGVLGSEWIRRKVDEAGLDPASVVIEIAETRVADATALYAFVERYRQWGFLIALDDFGAAHSNLDRLVRVEPDIIKIDRGLVHGVSESPARRLLLHSLADLCRRQGAVGLVEGVESAADALVLAHAGFDLFQGYLFGRPAAASLEAGLDAARVARQMAGEFEKYRRVRLVAAKQRSRKLLAQTQVFAETLRRCLPADFDAVLQELLHGASGVDCLFVTDARGVQVSHTVCRDTGPARVSILFQKAAPGADHGLKDYIAVPRRLGRQSYISSRYVSYATRTLCRTVSQEFTAMDGYSYFLCVDFEEEEDDGDA